MGKKNVPSQKEKEAKKRAIDLSENRLIPQINMGFTIDNIHCNRLNVPTVARGLIEGAERVHDGNTREMEAMLYCQAKTLEVLFNELASRATKQEGFGAMDMTQVYFDMAFKAQNMCRKTLLAISAIKHPQTATFVKQQNVGVNGRVI